MSSLRIGPQSSNINAQEEETATLLVAGITLNRNLYETVLRDLLCEGTEHTVQLYEGHGASWKLTRYTIEHVPVGAGKGPIA